MPVADIEGAKPAKNWRTPLQAAVDCASDLTLELARQEDAAADVAEAAGLMRDSALKGEETEAVTAGLMTANTFR
jgi:hypothetical protein